MKRHHDKDNYKSRYAIVFWFDGDTKEILFADSYCHLFCTKFEFNHILGRNMWEIDNLYKYRIGTKNLIKYPYRYARKIVKNLKLSKADVEF